MLTTSRYPSSKTKIFAKNLAGTIGTLYSARGKKSVESIIQLARKKGEERICIVVENNKKPQKIMFIKVNEDATWAWLPGEIEINGA
ncbi:MAG TPA: hypothetical protein VI912_04175 [Candidatus Bilamarchaeaceae archaeon]|nr:hypothetical protein [Candidatus Bilamarchaeaceae archaeon]